MTVDQSTLRELATSDVDLFSDEILLDPYPTFAALRERAAVVYLPKNDVYAFTRYAEIRDALANHEVFSSAKFAFNDTMNDILKGTSLTTDPPDHAPLRAALTENLAPRALRGMKAEIDEKADTMVAELVERGSFDAVDDLARALPRLVVADLIGISGEPRDNILRWGEAAFNVLGPMNQRTAENFPVAGELFGWASGVTADDLAPGSMGRAIFDAAGRGAIPAGAAPKIIHQYVAAGMDTTVSSIGNAIYHLARNPDQFEILRADPSLVPSAFNEVLRIEAPPHAFSRLVRSDVVIDGTLVPKDARLALLFGSGNRDPRHYDNPDTFQVRRNPIDHLSFGYGPHTCAGQGLARLEAHAVLDALVRRVRSFEVGEGRRKINNATRGYDSLPVTSLVAA
ncbi:cytochrome P450 [Tessaracoccus sp. Z1128]